MPLLSIIIVSYNSCALTLECLDNLRNVLTGVDHDIWVVDNASSDNTLEQISAQFPSVHIIANQKNAGFGVANNMAMERAESTYFMLLNSDAFPKAGSVQEMIAYMDSHPETDLVGPRVLNRDGTIQMSVHPYYSPWNEFLSFSGLKRLLHRSACKHPSTPYWMSGCCLLFKHDVYAKTGGFDPAYFFYCEDADLQMRMHKLGLRIEYLDIPQVVHYQGASGADKRFRYSLWYLAMLDLFIIRHYHLAGIIFYRFSLVLWCLRKLLYFEVLKALGHRNDFALRLHAFFLKHAFSSSHKIQQSILIN